MNDQKRAIFDALNGIDPALIEEAAQNRTAPRTRLLRFAAAAAVLAVLLTCLFFLPDGKSEPLFFVSVKADDQLNIIVTMTAQAVEDLPEGLDPSWEKQEVFCVEVRMDNALPEYLAASKVTVEYMGRNVTDNAAWQQLSVQFPEDNSDGTLCRIYGWASNSEEARLNFTVTVSNTADGVETLLCAQPFRAFYNRNSLIVNREITNAESWTMELMSTEQLIEKILKDPDSPMFTALSTSSSEDKHDLTRRWYTEIVAVLDTRDDVGHEILNKLQEFRSYESKEEYSKQYSNPEGDYILILLLQGSYFDQLTEEEVAQYDQLGLPSLLGD